MLGIMGFGAGAIYSVFMLLVILWAVSLVVIWNDADETYGTGFFWALAVLVAPFAAIPAYWLMRLGTHRSLSEDIAASERQERRKQLGQRLSGMALDIDRQMSPGKSPEPSQPSGGPRSEFTPFTPTFAAEAEEWRRLGSGSRAKQEVAPDQLALTGNQSQCDQRAFVPQSTDSNASSQGCGDSTGVDSAHERLSWRYRHPAVKSRWDTSRKGGADDAARRRVPQ